MDIFYKERADLLFLLGKKREQNNNNHIDFFIDCETNVTSLFEKLMNNVSNIKSVFTCSNNNCHYTKIYRYITKAINVKEMNCESETTVYESLVQQFESENRNCIKCKNCISYHHYELNCMIVFDVEHLFETAFNEGNLELSKKFIKFLPEHLTILEKQYTLIGTITFIPTRSRTGSYYTAFLRKPNSWEERNDLASKPTIYSLNHNFEVHCAIVIYVQTN